MRTIKGTFGKGHKPWNFKPKINKECPACLVSFETPQGTNERKFCSKSCMLHFPKSDKTKLLIKNKRATQIITLEHRRAIARGTKNYYKENPKSKSPVSRRDNIEYVIWRESVFKRDDYTCQECKVRGGELNAHHIKPYVLFLNLRYTKGNGLTLCVKCHNKTKTNLIGLWNQFGQEIMDVIEYKMLRGEI